MKYQEPKQDLNTSYETAQSTNESQIIRKLNNRTKSQVQQLLIQNAQHLSTTIQNTQEPQQKKHKKNASCSIGNFLKLFTSSPSTKNAKLEKAQYERQDQHQFQGIELSNSQKIELSENKTIHDYFEYDPSMKASSKFWQSPKTKAEFGLYVDESDLPLLKSLKEKYDSNA